MKNYNAKYLLSLIRTLLISIAIVCLIPVVLRIVFAQDVALKNSMGGPFPPEYWEEITFQMNFGWFFEWIRRFIKGDLVSLVIATGVPVTDLITPKALVTTEIITYALIISSAIGIPLGILSKRTIKKPIELIFRSTIVVLLMIICFMGIYYQYIAIQHGDFPIIGFKTPGYDNPDEITGFRLLDCLLSFRYDLFGDTLKHIILPMLTLVLPMSGLVIWITRSMIIRNREKEFNAPKWIAYGMLGIVLMTFMGLITELVFNLKGSGMLFSDAFNFKDYPLYLTMILRFSFILIISYNIWAVIAHSIEFTLRKKEERNRVVKEGTDEPMLNPAPVQQKIQESEPSEIPDRSILRNWVSLTFSCTAIAVFLGMVVYFAVVAPILPNWDDFFYYFYPGSFAVPTPEHPWGTGAYGRDVFHQTNLTLLSYLANIGIISAFTLVIGGILIAGYVWLRSLGDQEIIPIFTDLLKDLAFLGVFILGFIIVFAPNIVESGTTTEFLVPDIIYYVYVGLFGGLLCFNLYSVADAPHIGKDRVKKDLILRIPQIIIMCILFSVFFMFFYQFLNFMGIGIQQYTLGSMISDHKSALIYAPFATFYPLFALILVSFLLVWNFSSLEHTSTLLLQQPRVFILKSQERIETTQ